MPKRLGHTLGRRQERKQNCNASSTSRELEVVLHPDVAIFVNVASAAVRTAFDDGAGFLSALIRDPPQHLAASGAPVRIFLLSDLLLPDVDWFNLSHCKMCVFLNAFVLPPNVEAAIELTLKRKSVPTTLVFTFGAGLFDDAMAPRAVNITAISALEGPANCRGNRKLESSAQRFGACARASPRRQLELRHQRVARHALADVAVAGSRSWRDHVSRQACSSQQVADAVEVHGRNLMVHASAACDSHLTMHAPKPRDETCEPPASDRAPCGHPPCDPSDGCTVALGCCCDSSGLAETELNWGHQPPSNSSCAKKCHHSVPTPPPWPPRPPDPGPPNTSRTVFLPVTAMLRDEAGAMLCERCTNFTTAPLRAGQVQVFQLL